MHIVDFFKEICELYQWSFDYGTRSYLNLNDLPVDNELPDNIYFLCDPVVITDTRNDNTNTVEDTRYSGAFFFCVKSHLDQKYKDEKFTKNIKPLKTELDNLINNHIGSCSEYTIIRWKLTEIINVFDTNVDGYLVEFEIKEDFI
ncbi:MAG TPA: hypothetical protein PKI46_05180 [Bacteroidales bacterium]|nr:hypothetical protein [Bacteroidales bacterium]